MDVERARKVVYIFHAKQTKKGAHVFIDSSSISALESKYIYIVEILTLCAHADLFLNLLCFVFSKYTVFFFVVLSVPLCATFAGYGAYRNAIVTISDCTHVQKSK